MVYTALGGRALRLPGAGLPLFSENEICGLLRPRGYAQAD
jgi:hypothetical protein